MERILRKILGGILAAAAVTLAVVAFSGYWWQILSAAICAFKAIDLLFGQGDKGKKNNGATKQKGVQYA